MTEFTVPTALPVLDAGSHLPHEGKACVMEYVSLLAGENWTDLPMCTLPLLAFAAQNTNDNIEANEDRALLVPLIGRLFGSAGTGEYSHHEVVAMLATYAHGRLVELAKNAPVDPLILKSANDARRLALADPDEAGFPKPSSMSGAQLEHWRRTRMPDTVNAARVVAHLMFQTYRHGGAVMVVAELSKLLDEYDSITGRTGHRVVSGAELGQLAGIVSARA